MPLEALPAQLELGQAPPGEPDLPREEGELRSCVTSYGTDCR